MRLLDSSLRHHIHLELRRHCTSSLPTFPLDTYMEIHHTQIPLLPVTVTIHASHIYFAFPDTFLQAELDTKTTDNRLQQPFTHYLPSLVTHTPPSLLTLSLHTQLLHHLCNSSMHTPSHKPLFQLHIIYLSSLISHT